MPSDPVPPRRPRPGRRGFGAPVLAVLAALLLAALAGSGVAGAAAGSDDRRPGPPAVKPTIVFVHGAFADSSGWNTVIGKLLAAGYPALAFSNPLRGPVADGEYLKQFLGTIEGPVVLVGHSYGGAVISNGATDDVKALVFIAAYAPEAGESVAQANELGGGHTDVTDHLVLRPYPGAPPGDADATIDPEWFPRLFAQDLPVSTARVMAATQRPGALAALVTPSGPPAWTTIPSWYMVAKQDRIIPPEAERVMAARAKATTVTVNTSHVPMISQPDSVMKLILAAARS